MIMGAPHGCRYRVGMTGPVTARIADRAGWIRSGDQAIPSRFHAAATVDGFDVTLFAVVGERGPGAISVTIEQPRAALGEPVTHRVLRKLTIDQIVRDALRQLSRPAISAESETGIPGTFRVEGDDPASVRGGRPVPEPGPAGPRGRDLPGGGQRRPAAGQGHSRAAPLLAQHGGPARRPGA